MMGGLEFGKVVLASFLARYWKKLSFLFRIYFSVALLILILITSGGIFGYLSDGYQKTKGSYDVNEKEVVFIKQKIDLFTKQKETIDKRISSLTDSRVGQERRLDSLYSRRQNSTAKSVESYIAKSNSQLDDLTKQSSVLGDSISKYSLTQLNKETQNATGELGPLKYLATIFNTDMDTIVKWFIFMLIFVFDPLAVLLFVSLNIIIKNETEGDLQDRVPSDIKGKFKTILNDILPKRNKKEETQIEDDVVQNIEPEIIKENIEEKDTILEIEKNNISDSENITETIVEKEPLKEEPLKEEPLKEEPLKEEIKEEIKEPEISKQHEFYHDDSVDGFHTANFSIERVHGKK
jgi:hypothetical protein